MNKETTIFIDTQDMEERYGEQLYQEYLEKENKQLEEKEELHLNRIDELTDRVVKLETNRDEAIKYLKYALDEEKETPSKHNDWRLDLLEILRGGSNE